MIQNASGLIQFGNKKREQGGQQSSSGAAINGKSDNGPGNIVYNRHYGGNNFAFMDGHAKYLMQSDYFIDNLWTIDPND